MIVISEYSCENRFFNNLRTSLDRKFEVNRSRDLEKANWFAACLIALQDLQSARAFLESYVFDIKDDPRSYARGYQLDALGMLAYICFKKADHACFKKCMKSLECNNRLAEDIESLRADTSSELEYSLESRNELKSMIGDLTDKELATGYCSNILMFSHYYSLLVHKAGSQDVLSMRTLEFLEAEFGFLKELLEST